MDLDAIQKLAAIGDSDSEEDFVDDDDAGGDLIDMSDPAPRAAAVPQPAANPTPAPRPAARPAPAPRAAPAAPNLMDDDLHLGMGVRPERKEREEKK